MNENENNRIEKTLIGLSGIELAIVRRDSDMVRSLHQMFTADELIESYTLGVLFLLGECSGTDEKALHLLSYLRKIISASDEGFHGGRENQLLTISLLEGFIRNDESLVDGCLTYLPSDLTFLNNLIFCAVAIVRTYDVDAELFSMVRNMLLYSDFN